MNFRYTKSEIIARHVLDECGLADPTELPLKDIILGRKIYYQEIPLDGKDGEIVSVGGRGVISVNARIPFETRKRFTAAHELGHFELHRHLAPVFVDTELDLIDWYQSGTHETEANEFAAEFLMPTETFHDECKGRKFGPQTIEHLSSRFQASKTATILRFVKRGNHPICIVFCRENKMKWWKKSEDFRYFLTFLRDKTPPIDSVAYEVFTTTNRYYDNEQKQSIWKSTWFELRSGERDKIFYEFCLFVSSYKYTLSVIWED